MSRVEVLEVTTKIYCAKLQNSDYTLFQKSELIALSVKEAVMLTKLVENAVELENTETNGN